jgi:hypothetical protein
MMGGTVSMHLCSVNAGDFVAITRTVSMVFCALLLSGLESVATSGGERKTIWDLPLGQNISTMPEASQFSLLACGSDGGPPLRKLMDWTAFGNCSPEADGLREVYLEYDNAAEAAGLATGRYVDPAEVGTAEAFFPVVASALFDAGGTLRAVRLITDPRRDSIKPTSLPRLRPRGEHYLLAGYLAERFGIEPGDCRDIAPERGETPVIGQFVKRHCEKTSNGIRYSLEQHYLRKRGQHDIDPETGQLSDGQFESWTRAEIHLAAPTGTSGAQ